MEHYQEQNTQEEQTDEAPLRALPKVTYKCGGCEQYVQLTRVDTVICEFCGRKVLFKVRNKKHMLVYDGR